MQKRSYEILVNHPVNLERKKKGLNPGNSLWFWGAGTKPSLINFEKKFQKKGAMISAVDLLKGIAVGTGMQNITVEVPMEACIPTMKEKPRQLLMQCL